MKLTKTQKKVIIGTSVGVLGAAAIVTPIVITYINNKGNWPFMVDELDQRTGITVDTYNSMKDQFKKAYKQKLEEKWTPADEMEDALAAADESLAELDQQFQSNLDLAAAGTDEPLDYTKLTSALSSYAKSKCGISLTRKSNYTINDLREGYEQLRSANALYMQGLGTLSDEKIEARLREADEQYNQIEQELVAAYPGDDLAVYNEGSKRILECFEAENAEIAALSAQTKLTQFMENTSITYKKYDPAKNEDAIPNYYSSDLIQNKFQINSVIRDDMNLVYNFVDKSSNSPITFDTKRVLPGYTVEPILKEKFIDDMSKANIDAKKELAGDSSNEEVSQDATDYTNAYSLGFDWTVKSERYLKAHPKMSNAEMDTVTAHLRGPADMDEIDDDATINETFSEMDVQVLAHPIGEGVQQASKRLTQTYLSGLDAQDNLIDKLEFRFSEDPNDYAKNKLEKLFDEVNTDTNGEQEVFVHSSESLAKAGVQVRQIHVVSNTDPITGKKTTYTEDDAPWLKLETFYNTFESETAGKTDDEIKAITTNIDGKTCNIGLIYEFVKQCSLEATATVDDASVSTYGPEMFKVSNCKLYVRYKDDPDDWSHLTQVGKTFEFYAPLSKEYFTACADKYNRVRDEFSVYIDEENIITELQHQDAHFWITESLYLVSAGIELALLIWRMIWHMPVIDTDNCTTSDWGTGGQAEFEEYSQLIESAMKADPTYYGSVQLTKLLTDGKQHVIVTQSIGKPLTTKQKVAFFVCMTMEIVKVGIDMAIWGALVTDPILDAASKIKKFKKNYSEEISKVSTELSDYEKVFPRLKDNKSLEYGDDFDSKYAAFSQKLEGKPFADFNAEYNLKWNNIEKTGIYADLLAKAKKEKVGINDFIEIFSNFGLSNVVSLAITGVGVAFSIASFILLWNVPGKRKKMFKVGFAASIVVSVIIAGVKFYFDEFKEKSYNRVESNMHRLQERVLAENDPGYKA